MSSGGKVVDISEHVSRLLAYAETCLVAAESLLEHEEPSPALANQIQGFVTMLERLHAKMTARPKEESRICRSCGAPKGTPHLFICNNLNTRKGGP